MILPFSTQLNGKPTYFPEKIVTGLEHKKIITFDEAEHLFATKVVIRKSKKELGLFTNTIIKLDGAQCYKTKLHTIREDKNDRWKVGTKIDFFINVRQPSMFRFAPVLPVVSTQKIYLAWKENTENLTYCGITYDRTCTILIDDLFYGDAYLLNDYVVTSSYNIESFAHNDGFDTIEDFFNYFKNDFKGKLIHWTPLKY